jgi:hypothetical protein
MIDLGNGVLPKGFSERLADCYSPEIYATPDLEDGDYVWFISENNYVLVTPKEKKSINYRELGSYELVDAIFSEGDYLHSFFIARNIFLDETGKKVKLIALLYEARDEIHIWNPAFEELFLPLIKDDLYNGTNSHWKSIQEIHLERSRDLNVYDIVVENQVDYEIALEDFRGISISTVVYYALLKHIFLVEDEKYPSIPGADRTLQAYRDLYADHLKGSVNMIKWRQIYNLKNHWA